MTPELKRTLYTLLGFVLMLVAVALCYALAKVPAIAPYAPQLLGAAGSLVGGVAALAKELLPQSKPGAP